MKPELDLHAIELLAVCSTVDDLVAAAAVRGPDTLLVDLSNAITLDVLAELRRAAPRAKIVLWVEEISVEFAFQALSAGVAGVLRKSLPVELITKCLENVHKGELWFETALTNEFLNNRRVSLSPREGQFVRLIAHGLKNKEIAHELGVTEGTVKVYLSRLFQKVGVKDRWELSLWGLKNLTNGHGTLTRPPNNRDWPSIRSLVIPPAA